MKNPKQRLTAELHEMLQREQVLQRHLRNLDGRTPEVREDWMHVVENDEVVEALDARTLRRIREIVAALDRIDAGTYGRSVQSGRPIEPERLEAIPWATLTSDEARAAEGKLGPQVDAGASRDKARPIETGGAPPGRSSGPGGSRDRG